MKKYLYSCTYSWMCRSFDGLYFAPTKEMEVSHKTVAFASLLLGLIVCKKFMFKFKNERKTLLYYLNLLCYLYLLRTKKDSHLLTQWLQRRYEYAQFSTTQSIYFQTNTSHFFLQLFPIQRRVPWCLCDPLHQQYPNSRL